MWKAFDVTWRRPVAVSEQLCPGSWYLLKMPTCAGSHAQFPFSKFSMQWRNAWEQIQPATRIFASWVGLALLQGKPVTVAPSVPSVLTIKQTIMPKVNSVESFKNDVKGSLSAAINLSSTSYQSALCHLHAILHRVFNLHSLTRCMISSADNSVSLGLLWNKVSTMMCWQLSAASLPGKRCSTQSSRSSSLPKTINPWRSDSLLEATSLEPISCCYPLVQCQV